MEVITSAVSTRYDHINTRIVIRYSVHKLITYNIAKTSVGKVEYKHNSSTKEIFSMVLLHVPCDVLLQFLLIGLFVARNSQMYYQ